MSTMELPFEGHRLVLITHRDGEQAAVDFAAQTHKAYRLSLKFGMAQEKPFRRSYIESCADFRKFLKAYNAYQAVLTAIHHA